MVKRDIFLAVALCGLALVLAHFPLADTDTWWHLAAGRMIWNDGLPRVDTWTYTADKPWIDLYWFPQLVFYGLYSAGGASALVALKMAAAVGIAALILASMRKQAPSWLVALVMVPVLVLVTGRLRERPELFSLVYLTAFLAVIAAAEARPKLLLWLPALQILWVNSHGLFVLGPALSGAHLVATLVERRPRKLAGLVLVLSLAACLANPYGLGVFTHLAQQAHQLDEGLYRRSLAELQTFPELFSRAGWSNPYVLAAMLTFATGLVSFLVRGSWPRVFRVLVFLAGCYLAWCSVRLVPVFAILAAVVSLANLAEVLAHRRYPWPASAMAVVAVAAWVASGSLYRWSGDGRTVGLGEAPGAFAHEACAFLAERGPSRIIAANITQASVCTWHLRPTQRQFLISRIEPARDDAFPRYVAGIGGLLRGDDGWEVPLGIDRTEPRDVPAIMIERGLAPAADTLVRDPRWSIVYRDEMAAVFVPVGIQIDYPSRL